MTKVLITGASRGMGFAAAQQLAAQGCLVLAGARNTASLNNKRSETDDRNGELRALTLDVTDDESVATAVAEVERTIGSIDVLVNNAGIPGTFAPAEEVTADDFGDVLATNLLGPVRVTQAFIPLLRCGAKPRIVNVSSGMGSMTMQGTDDDYREIAHLPYPATKAALNMLTVQYAKGLPDVIVTSVDPGLTATEFTGGQGGSVDDSAAVIAAVALDTDGPSGRFVGHQGAEPW